MKISFRDKEKLDKYNTFAFFFGEAKIIILSIVIFKLEEILKAIINGKDKVKGSNVFTFYLKCQNQWTAISYTYNIILRATTKKWYAKGHTQKYYRYIKIKFWKKFK